MSESAQIEWPQKDVDALFRQMQASAKLMNDDQGTSLKKAVWYLVRSLGASTSVAPAYREYAEIDDPITKATSRRGTRTFMVRGWFGKPRKLETKTVRARSVATLKRYHAKITHRGLAKLTWGLMVRDMRAGENIINASSFTQAITTKVAGQHIETASQFKGADVFAEIHNLLPYIRAAVKPDEINSAFDRAARAMMESTTRQLVKRMGLGSLSR